MKAAMFMYCDFERGQNGFKIGSSDYFWTWSQIFSKKGPDLLCEAKML